jgi:dipeptidyl aminopeptidase/acylaminoacyl peptidase
LVNLLPVSISELIKVPIIMAFDFDRDGRFVLYSSNETGIPHLYVLSTKPGSKPRHITSGKDPVLGGILSPGGDKLVYPQDKDGNEIHHLFLLPVEGGEAKQITEKPYSTMGVDWHPNKKEVTRPFASMKSCGLETINLETGECFMLKEPTLPLMGVEYSHDGKWLACTMLKSFKNMQVLIVNRDDPADTIVYSIKDDSKDVSPVWSLDDKKLAFVSDANGRPQIVVQEFQGDERIFLGLEEDEEAAGPAVWSPEGDKVYYAVSKQSRITVHGHLIGGEKEPALPFPKGTVTPPKISKDGKIMVALHSSMISPSGIYLHKIGSKSATLLTPRNYKVDLTQLVQPQSIWYKSFDGRKIHGWYLPAASGTAPHPAVIYAHGGPWGQVFDGWFEGVFLHALSQNGLAAFAPNFRGSTGYGAEFQEMDIGDPGGGDLEDVVYGAEWLRKQSGVDSSKIAIMGASYGGYTTLIALTKKPEAFAAGVSLVPVADWLEMYQLSDPVYRAFMDTLFEGPPSKKEKLYRDRSPAAHVSDIKAPVMIMAGKQDYRCPIQPIEKFVNKLKEMNHPHEFVLEEKAGHISALLKWEESIPLFTSIINYFKKVLT